MNIAFYGSSLLSSYLERRRHLLPRPSAGARRPWPRHHVLRAGYSGPAKPSGHRAACLVQGCGVSGHE